MSTVRELAASGEAAKSGPLGLVVILVLAVACYFLFRSMSRHLKTVREDFPTELPPDPLHPTVAARPTPADTDGTEVAAAPAGDPPGRPDTAAP